MIGCLCVTEIRDRLCRQGLFADKQQYLIVFDYFYAMIRYLLGMLTTGILVSFNTAAQRLNIGLEAGIPMTIARMNFAGSDAFEQKRVIQAGFTAGPLLEYRLSAQLRLESGILVSLNRHQNKYTNTTTQITLTNTVTTLSLPLLLKYPLSPKIDVSAGGIALFPLHSTQQSLVTVNGDRYTSRNATKSITRSFMPAVQAGLGYRINAHWHLNAQYQIMPNGYFERPNYNNQYFGTVHTLILGLRYWKN
ncbi:hypothetical protein DBR32_05055 [Taibaiella sp. KBW10]|uniref:outer membrane beta-barrel protein n=1 Tax=Taibaiella sp. KBW10 TaxID=2153357 RepID=UPI000F5961B4|nr:outer membrane beta-barrel protein [Taibaiella sp. KBW10]RQO31335.1 hypothetical protein DBR32_05055 [Taibaiella sp. KBW10]